MEEEPYDIAVEADAWTETYMVQLTPRETITIDPSIGLLELSQDEARTLGETLLHMSALPD